MILPHSILSWPRVLHLCSGIIILFGGSHSEIQEQVVFVCCFSHYIPRTYLSYNWKFVLLAMFIHFTHSSSPTPTTTHLFYLWVWFFFGGGIPHTWDHTIFVFPWLISLNITPLRSICVVANGRISFFMTELYSIWYTYICLYVHIYTPHFLSPYSHQWTQVVSMSWPLWIMVQWIWGCR